MTSSALSKVHVTEASHRPSRGSFRKPPFRPSRYLVWEIPHKPQPFFPKSVKDTCHKCGRNDHFARECRATSYVVEMYKELQKFRDQSRKNYNFHIHSDSNQDVKNYMIFHDQITLNPYVVFLDIAFIATILTNQFFL